jgi:hypothetical protein
MLQVDALNNVLVELLGDDAEAIARIKGRGRGRRGDDDNAQLDQCLPPEKNTDWVQCDACRKWRRVPWNVDADVWQHVDQVGAH